MFANIQIGKKLAISLIPPLLGLVVLSGVIISDRYREMDELGKTSFLKVLVAFFFFAFLFISRL